MLRICFSLYLHSIIEVAPGHILLSPRQTQLLLPTLFLQEFLGNSREQEDALGTFLSSSSPSPHSCVPIYLCEAPAVCPHEWLPESPADTRPPRRTRRSEALILQLVSKRKQELLKFQIVRAARSIFTGRVYYVTVVKMFNSRIWTATLFNKKYLDFF